MRMHGKIRTLLALGSVLGLGVVGTWAVFSDDASFTTTIETGTLDLSFDDDQQGPITAPYVVDALSQDNVKPGVPHYGTLLVNNDGSIDFTYQATAVNLQGGSVMDGAVDLAVAVTTDAANCSATGWSSLTPVAGTVTSFGTLTGMTARSLSAGTSELLCLRWTLDADAGNTLQGQTFEPIVTFTATQS